MILTERQIKKIKDAWIKAEQAEHKAHAAAEKLRKAIVKATGVDGQVDYMAGDGHGQARQGGGRGAPAARTARAGLSREGAEALSLGLRPLRARVHARQSPRTDGTPPQP